MTIANDNFNRADGAIGSNWANHQGTLGIYSNQVRPSGSGWTYGGWVGTAIGADHYSQLKITAADGADSKDIGVCVRSSVGHCCACFGSGLRTYATTFSGTNRVAPSFAGPAKLNVNDVLRMEAKGVWARTFVNGIDVGGAPFSTDLPTGVPGVGGFGAGTIDLGDDWEGGDLPAEPTIDPILGVSDDFTRADAGLCTDSNGHWESVYKVAAGVGLRIVSNRLRVGDGVANASWCAARWRGSCGADQFAKTTIASFASPATNNELGPAVRVVVANDGTRHGYSLLPSASGSKLVRFHDNGGFEILTTDVTAWSVGDVAEIRAVGSRLYALQNGVEIYHYDDASYATGGVGIHGEAYTYTVAPSISAWAGGEVVSTSSVQPIVLII